MDGVNKTLYIPLYGKAYVSNKGVIIKDKKAEEIWAREGFALKGKAKSKWLAYYMAMRAAVYDEWLEKELLNSCDAVVLHIGCGMDSRVERVAGQNAGWYDIDFPEVIAERSKYYPEDDGYHMLAMDMREDTWKQHIEGNRDALIVLEGVSMYFAPEELIRLLSAFENHFTSVRILMDCYTERAAKISKYKNPINDVGVTTVYGYDDPESLADISGLTFVKEHDMTPQRYIDELNGWERIIFKSLFAGRIAKSMYRMYELKEGH